MLPMLPGRHLNFAQSSHHLSRLRQANSPVATAMMIRPLQVESLQGSRQCNQAHAQGIDKAVSRTSPVQAVGVSSSLLSPRLSQQKYRVLCIKAKRSAVLPGPFDTLVDSNIESAVRARILATSKELTGAAGSGGQVTTRLGATLAKQSPVEHLAKALFEQMDLPMISMPSIRRAGTHLSRPFWGEPGLSSLDR